MRYTDQPYLPEQPDYIPGERDVLTLAILGDLIPIAIWLYFNRRYGNDMGWQEGGGCIAIVLLMVVVFVVELSAYRLATKKITPGCMGQCAKVIAGISLLAVGGLILFLFRT